jgi:hypothetical protein
MVLRNAALCLAGAIRALAIILGLASAQTAGAVSAAPPTPPYLQPIYAEIIPTSAPGVPYNPPADRQESFIAPNGRTVKVLVKGPQEDSPTYSRPIRDGESVDDYFRNVLQEAVNNHAHKLVIPRGTYIFNGPTMCMLSDANCHKPGACNIDQYWNCSPHWTISGVNYSPISDLEIDLSGSALNFSAPAIGIDIYNAQRIRLKNFTIDWPLLPIGSLGTIIPDPRFPGHNALAVDPQYPMTAINPEYTMNGVTPPIQAVNLWDANAADLPGQFDATAGDNLSSHEVYFFAGYSPQPTYVGGTTVGNVIYPQVFSCEPCNVVSEPTRSNPYECNFNARPFCANFDYFPVYSRVVVRHYIYNGQAIYVSASSDIDIEGATVLTSPGMGIAVNSSGGQRGFRIAHSVIKRPLPANNEESRPVSTASDAINVGQFAGDVIVEKNEIAYQGDDAINLWSQSGRITAVGVLSAAQGAMTVAAPYSCADSPDNVGVGDSLALFDRKGNYLDTATVQSAACDYGNNQQQVVFSCVSEDCWNTLSSLNRAGSFADLTQQPNARFIIRDNLFYQNRGHGTLLSVPYGLVTDNTYAGNTIGNIALTAGSGSGGFFCPSNVVIDHNNFGTPGELSALEGALSVMPQTAAWPSMPTIQKIVITKNTFTNTPGPAAIIGAARYIMLGLDTVSNADQTPINDNGGRDDLTDSILTYQVIQGYMCNMTLDGSSGPIGNRGPPIAACGRVARAAAGAGRG